MGDRQIESDLYILFQIAETTYAVASSSVQQVEMVEHITPVPNALPYLDGLVLSRGQVIPAINLRARFGFERIPFDQRTRLIVVRAQNRTVGWIVDTAREFVRIPREAIQPPPEAISGLSGQYLEGIVHLQGRLVLILNANEVLSAAETALIQKTTSD